MDDHELKRLRARVGALEDLVAHLLERTGTPADIVTKWRGAAIRESEYMIRGAANEIIARDLGLPSPLGKR